MQFIRKLFQSENTLKTHKEPVETERPEDETPSLFQSESRNPVIIITMIEVANEDKQLIIDEITEKYADDYEVVYIVDDPDFSLLRRNGQMFEYFPSTLQQKIHKNLLPWPGYLTERWMLLLSKWNPKQIISFGRNIDGFISAAPNSSASG